VPRELIGRSSRGSVLAPARRCPDDRLVRLTFQLLLETRNSSLLLVNPGSQKPEFRFKPADAGRVIRACDHWTQRHRQNDGDHGDEKSATIRSCHLRIGGFAALKRWWKESHNCGAEANRALQRGP
jgi:hypothetical protein